MADAKCAIWGTSAQTLEKSGDFEVFDSPRAGGKYWVSGSALGEILPLNNSAKRLLTSWLCEQRSLGVDIPQIRSGVLGIIGSRRSLTTMERLTAALRAFVELTPLGEDFAFGTSDQNTFPLLALTESQGMKELRELVRMLESQGYIAGTMFMDGSGRMRPTVLGWQEAEKLDRVHSASSQAFIAMWFNDSVQDAYMSGIAPAVIGSGYKPLRIDQKEHNNKIDDEIVAEIRRSRFVVADFTCEPEKPRGGVYYEAGYAHGLGLPVIWTCREDAMKYVHFDTRQYAHIIWTTPDDLFNKLKNRIGATIGDGPLPKTQGQ